eukprot:SAG31_NODE_3528_length_4153_cov_1.648249_4_plen_215_part_00
MPASTRALTFARTSQAQDVANCGFNRLGEPIFDAAHSCFPDTLDWFGYDYYCTIPGCTSEYGVNAGWRVARDGMTNMIYPKLGRATQRVVPTALGFFYKTVPFNTSMQAEMDEYCVQTAEHYLDWARQDSRLVAIFPFFWGGGYGRSMLGLSGLPRCAAKWVEIGTAVVRSRAARPTALSGGGKPHSKRSCPNTHEKVSHWWCQKDIVMPPRLA